ncbi:SRPBCC family protein [Pseudonocardia acaciae]|uniref:SRPBCC family protein n=1 Tax=Pseudonocardia acaciae TaxID=551276 RepID=UPI000491E83C|nr:SRPBCC family protein [Pseudonocardia acaciae]
MQLENTFTVPAGIDEAWAAFNDPRRVAPCFPGATLDNYEGDSFTGTVKVKLGPISLTYKGKGTFVERDEKARKVVIEASGRDSRGNGTASATVTGTLHADGDNQTTVKMVTDMTVTGRPAQFGRGVMADVSDKIVGQFSSCLANKLGKSDEAAAPETAAASSPAAAEAGAEGSAAKPAAATKTAPAPAASTASANGVAPKLAAAPEPSTRSEVDAIDLLDTAGAPVLKRLGPLLIGLLVVFVVIRRSRRRRRSS